ncbi:MAG: STAS domain-containing protein [Acidobacteria bacterium]|nr:STAS domain-containing protein [Acidobacteriota bacterium]
MAEQFSVEAVEEGDATVVRLGGYLDAHTAPEFEATLQEKIDAGRIRLVVDCAGLQYISSAGLGVFMGFIEDLRENGGDLKICSLIPKVREVFELLGFDALFEIFDDRQAALRSFPQEAGKEGA